MCGNTFTVGGKYLGLLGFWTRAGIDRHSPHTCIPRITLRHFFLHVPKRLAQLNGPTLIYAHGPRLSSFVISISVFFVGE